MRLRSLPISVFLWLSIALAGNSLAQQSEDTAEFLGEYWTDTKDDTLTIRYRFTPDHFDPDSVVLKMSGGPADLTFDVNQYLPGANSVIVYRRSEPVPYANDWRQVDSVDHRLWLSGVIRIPLNGQKTDYWFMGMRGYYTDERDSVQMVYTDEYINETSTELGMEMWMPSYGYFKSELAPPFDRKGLFLGLGISGAGSVGHWRFMLSTSWSGLGKDFSFSEPFRAGARYYTGTRSNWMPQLYAAVKMTKLKLKRDDDEWRKLQWGGEFGLAFEGPFERIGYHYSTALGGYHAAELYLCMGSGTRTKVGTRYLFQTNGDVWMVRVSLHWEGLDALAGGRAFKRLNTRPLPHKILSILGGGPWAVAIVCVLMAMDS